VNSDANGILTLPADPSAVQGPFDRMWDLVQTGGPVVAILALMSVTALTIIIAKIWQFHRGRVWDRRTAREALYAHRHGRTDAALAHLRGTRSPVARLLAHALHGQLRSIPEDRVREEVLRHGAQQLAALRGWFRPLEVIASLAPLLGLFGTVLGMIEAFQQLESAGNQVNPAILSGGIWEALLTTAVGLAVAIPVVAVFNWLERVVDKVALEMDNIVTQVFTDDLSDEPEEFRSRATPRLRAAAAGE